jgi:hypothetical protein
VSPDPELLDERSDVSGSVLDSALARRDVRVGIDCHADLRDGHGVPDVDRFMRARHGAKVGPVGAHPSVKGHYSNAGRLSSG